MLGPEYGEKNIRQTQLYSFDNKNASSMLYRRGCCIIWTFIPAIGKLGIVFASLKLL